MALSDGVVYVPINDLSSTFKNKTEKIATNGAITKGTGEVVR
jgi:hypothetical protein